jgi:HD-GYP domain-containing protein (c-di-GMP phosphodiesterase class II)
LLTACPALPHLQESIMKAPALRTIEHVNKELWILLGLFVVSLLLNHLIAAQRMVLSFYALPTLVSAYFYGRRHATLTALASVLLVVLMLVNPGSPGTLQAAGLMSSYALTPSYDVWLELAVWGGSLIVTGYLMGTLHEHKSAQVNELRETYDGVLMILRHFVSNDEYTENHCYRVSQYATRLAGALGLRPARIEDVRAASLLHDIGKLDISRELLLRAARLTRAEFEQIRQQSASAADLASVGGSLRTVIPIVLAHGHRFDGTGGGAGDERIPLEARIITVADVYDGLTTDRPYRKALSQFEARDVIRKGAGTEFDPAVVDALETLLRKGELEIWSAPVAAA